MYSWFRLWVTNRFQTGRSRGGDADGARAGRREIAEVRNCPQNIGETGEDHDEGHEDCVDVRRRAVR